MSTANRCPHIFKKPEFYVFYNGTEDYPETTTLKLSDAFITKPEQIPLELTVQVLNINTDKANKILTACKPLEEYSLFVEEVRKQTQIDHENGFTNAVKICIEKGIEQGLEQGSYQKAIETAKNPAEMGFAVETIAKATGLSIEEIEKL